MYLLVYWHGKKCINYFLCNPLLSFTAQMWKGTDDFSSDIFFTGYFFLGYFFHWVFCRRIFFRHPIPLINNILAKNYCTK